jgi:hypothetical protein
MYWQRSEIIMAAVRSGLSFEVAEQIAANLPDRLLLTQRTASLPAGSPSLEPAGSFFLGHVQEDADQVNGHVFHGFPAESVN